MRWLIADCFVKKNKKTKATKFKLRTKKNLITLRVNDESKANMINDSLKAIQRLTMQVVGEKSK